MRRLSLVVAIACMAVVTGASAQDAATPVAVPMAAAMDRLPDHQTYRVELVPSSMPQDQQQQLATMIGEAAAGQHFYGAVYSYRPDGQSTTEFKMRSGLHSRAAARAVALADCEAVRAADDSQCVLGWRNPARRLERRDA